MKNILALLLFVPWVFMAQSDHDNFRFKSNSIATNYYSGNGKSGFLAGLDLSFQKVDHIFKVSAMAAAEVDICLGECLQDNVYSFDALYGRELPIGRSMALDIFAGVGYFHLKTANPDTRQHNYVSEKTVGFPLQGRFRFRRGKIFNMGLQLHANINGASSIIAIGPFFQWNFHPDRNSQ